MKRQSVRQTLGFFFRCVDFFAGFVVLAQVLYYAPYFFSREFFIGDPMPERYIAVTALALMLPAFHSLLRTELIYDKTLSERFRALDPPPTRRRDRLAFWLRQRRFWGAAALFAGLFLLCPPGFYTALRETFLPAEIHFVDRLLLLAGVFPAGLLLGLWAALSACDCWCAEAEGRLPLPDAPIGKRSRSKRGGKNAAIASLTLFYLAASIAVNILIVVLPGFLPFLRELARTKAVIVCVAVLVLLWAARYVRVLVRRRAFFRRLRTVCAANGYTCSRPVHPYLSVFTMFDGETFSLTRGERVYSCKFLCVKPRRIPLLLRPDGICEFLYIRTFAHVELFRRVKAYAFGWKATGKKFLLLVPAPRRVCDLQGETDNGGTVGDCKIFTGTAFLNALERDCAER